jgi:MFS family permease
MNGIPFPTLDGVRALFRSYDRRLWVLYAGFVVSSMGFAMVVPFVSLYFHEELGVPMSLVGIFFLGTAVLRSFAQAYAGDLSDRIGRRRIMIAGQAGRAAFFAVMAWAVHVRLGFWPASGILGLSYLAGSFYQPVADAAVSDLVPRERRLEAYALLRVANNLGWGVGPMLGGMVSEIGYAWLFVFGGLTSAISSWLIWRHLAETHDSGRRAAMVRDTGPQGWKDVFEIRRDPRFLGFCVITLFLFIAMSQWLATLSVYASGRLGVSRTQLGLLFGMNGLLVVVFQFPVVRAIRRLSLAAALALGSLVYAVSFFSVAFAGNYAHLVLCMIAITLGELIASPPGTSLASLMAPPERMGRYLGWYGLTAVAGWSVGPFIGGLLLDRWSEQPLLLWGAVALIALGAAWGFWSQRRAYPHGGTTVSS